jgi:hypothetical protein
MKRYVFFVTLLMFVLSGCSQIQPERTPIPLWRFMVHQSHCSFCHAE